MKKILLASGCSYTDEYFTSTFHPNMDCTFPKWPELLANKLDMNYVNVGRSGAGNEYIYNSILDYISEYGHENIALVMVGWSQSFRKSWYRRHNNGPLNGRGWENTRVNKDGNLVGWMKTTLNYYLSFQILMERYNLKYKQFTMLRPFEDMLKGLRPTEFERLAGAANVAKPYKGDIEGDRDLIIKDIIRYDDKLNVDNFIGWPMVKEIGGFNVQDKVIGANVNLKCSSLDDHPNKEGHEKLAEFLYERLG